MGTLVVNRNSSGAIQAIRVRSSLLEREEGFAVAIGFLCFAIWIFAKDWHDAGDGQFGSAVGDASAIVLILFWGYVLFVKVKLVIQGRPEQRPVADPQGVVFYMYLQMGKVPWPDIHEFQYGDARILNLGNRVVYAVLEDERKYLDKIGWNYRLAPGRWRAPPFATVDGNHRVDLPALKPALEELQAQVRSSETVTRK